jgi:hypothetical protein
MPFAGGFRCRCDERLKPVKSRKWVVISRAGSHSDSRYSSKLYSLVHCPVCDSTGRSSAGYIADLPDGDFPIDT